MGITLYLRDCHFPEAYSQIAACFALSKAKKSRWKNLFAVESTINQGVSKRFVTKQQRPWTPKGAHVLLQTRT